MKSSPMSAAVIYHLNRPVALAHIVDTDQFHFDKINLEREVVCSFHKLLDKSLQPIPLAKPDTVDGYEFINQLPIGTLFVWYKKDVRVGNCSVGPLINYKLQGMDITKTSVGSKVTDEASRLTHLIERDVQDENTPDNKRPYTLLNNTDKDYLNLSLNWTKRKNQNAYTLYFSQLEGLSKVCQFFNTEPSTLCNAIITFRDSTEQRKLSARKCQAHITKVHGKYLKTGCSAEVLNNICPLRSDFDHLQKLAQIQNREKQEAPIAGPLFTKSKKKNVESVPLSDKCFKELVLTLVISGSGYSILDNEYFREWCQKYVANLWSNSWNKKQGSILLNSLSEKLKGNIRQLFISHEKYLGFKTLPLKAFQYNELEDQIKLFFKRKFVAEIPWASIEINCWTSNRNAECIRVTVNLTSRKLKKISLPIYFDEIEPEKKHELTNLLRDTSSSLRMSKFISSCCTKNTSNSLLGDDILLTEDSFQSFCVETECAIQQVLIFMTELISDLSEILKKSGKHYLLNSGEIERKNGPDLLAVPLSGAPIILTKLTILNGKLRRQQHIKRQFLEYVPSLPPLYSYAGWNVTFSLLKHFIDNFQDYMDFSQNVSTTTGQYKFNCSEDDYKIAKIIYEILIPFEAITNILSGDYTLSICYLPLLLYIRNTADHCASELSTFLGSITQFTQFNSMFHKYFSRALCGRYIHYASGLFHFDMDEVVTAGKVLHLDPIKILAELSYSLLEFKFDDNFEQEGIVKKNRLNAKFQLDTEEYQINTQRYALEQETPTNRSLESLSKKILHDTIRREFREFNIYRTESHGPIIEEVAKDMNLNICINNDSIEILDHDGNNDRILKESKIINEKIFILKSRCSLVMIQRYLELVRTNDSKYMLGTHSALPVILQYLLSINITSVNCDYSFSRLKRKFDDTGDSPDDCQAENEFLVTKAIQSLEIGISMTDFDEKGFKFLLETH